MKNRMRTVTVGFISIILIAGLALNGCSPSPESLVKTEYETFETYQKFKQWDKMWEMLHLDCQALFNNKADFVRQMEDAAETISLKNFTIGNIEIIPQWTNATRENSIGTDKTYANVAEIQVTFIYSTILGDHEYSQTVHSVKSNDRWAFFIGKKRAISSEAAETELSNIQVAVIALMVDNGLSTLPHPITIATTNMGAFPDATSDWGAVKGKIKDPDGHPYRDGDKAGYVLCGHDITGDGSQTTLVDYLTVRYSNGTYTVNALGTVTQVSTGYD